HVRGSIDAVTLGTAAAPGAGQSLLADRITGLPLGAPQSPLSSAGALAFDQAGNAWVADDGAKGGGLIWVLPADAAKHPQAAAATPVAGFTDAGDKSLRPDAMAFDSRGTLYVAMGRSGEIATISGLSSGTPV